MIRSEYEMRELRTLEAAVVLLDEWIEAYRIERRDRLREIHALHDRIFMLDTGIVWRDGVILLLRAQLIEAGIKPNECSDPEPDEPYPAEAEEATAGPFA